jgi:hypothetical protein
MGIECPTKLYYSGHKEYKNSKQEDSFLQMLADGGFQVGELAKLMYPGGHEITSKNHHQAEQETQEWLLQDEVVLFEPAIRFGDLFIRIDILVKRGNSFQLIEVKAKSYDTKNPEIEGARGGIKSGMLPYIQDVAFQSHVLRGAYPDVSVACYLMMPDKSKHATIDSLNQLFKVERADGRTRVHISSRVEAEGYGDSVLTLVNVDPYVNEVMDGEIDYPGGPRRLPEIAKSWALAYANNERIAPVIGAQCGRCEFRADIGDPLKSGFHECWKEANNWQDKDFDQGTILDLWNFKRKNELIQLGVVKLKQVSQEDLKFKEGENGLSYSERQWMQIDGIPEDQEGYFLDIDHMRAEMSRWKYPYHLIDFETAAVALSFHIGRRPYEQVAFQFSHHVMEEDGTVRHQDEFLLAEPGQFPNYEFARALMHALGSDDGSVFMWSHHENTILKTIAEQLTSDLNAPADKEELLTFINSLVKGGDRAMVDLCALATKSYFHPSTKGSSSIKKVLPAVLQSSEFLRKKYSHAIYGTDNGIPSLNFKDFLWWEADTNGKVSDPYEKLKIYLDDMLDDLAEEAQAAEKYEIAEGGAASTAYSRLQFENLDDQKRELIKRALLRYCELDTLAMVMIVESWQDWSIGKG